ncbi:hypothetical protein J2S32_000179 [Qipengyuania citrea]|jgi:hypothetical protein|nr:hypothetical protein [Qipengyuania citrea]
MRPRLGVCMRNRYFAVLSFGIFCGACATMNAPASQVRIVGSAEKVIWAYESSLPSRNKAAIKAHLQRYEQPRGLPVLLRAQPGDYIYVVPVCGNVTQWDRAGSKQVLPETLSITVHC